MLKVDVFLLSREEIVDDVYLVPFLVKPVSYVRADKTVPTRYQYFQTKSPPTRHFPVSKNR